MFKFKTQFVPKCYSWRTYYNYYDSRGYYTTVYQDHNEYDNEYDNYYGCDNYDDEHNNSDDEYID